MKLAIPLAIALLPSCTVDVAPAPDEERETALQSAAAAEPPAAPTQCVVNPKTGDAPVFDGLCATNIGNGEPKEVHALVFPRLVANQNAQYDWKVTSTDGAAFPAGAGCKAEAPCKFSVTPRCGTAAQLFALVVEVRDKTRPGAGVIEKGIVGALIPDDPNCQAGCTAPPSAVPGTSIFGERCGGLHTIFTNAVAGATHTQIQTRPPNVPWSALSDFYTFPGITADIGNGFSCPGDANGDFYARSRACNNCGCTAWGNEAVFLYFRGECS
jgi:hypothetical protein